MGSLNLSLGGLGRGVGGRSRQVRGEPTGVVQSCCEGHFGGRVDGPHPWPVPPRDVLGLGCTSSQKQSLGFSGSLSHLFPLLLYLCSLLSKLLSLCFSFCLRTEANTTQSGGGGWYAEKRGHSAPGELWITQGKARGPFGNWCAGTLTVAWALCLLSLSQPLVGPFGWHMCFSATFLTTVSPNHFLPRGTEGIPVVSEICPDLYGT